MKVCEAVIFDLGGVILDIDYKATEAALRQLMGPRADSYYQQTRQNPLFDDLETGRVDPAVFRQKIVEWAGRPLSDTAIDQAWNAMLGGLPLARLDFIKKMTKQFRVFLLSNTNVIHKAAFDQISQQTLAEVPFDSFFEAAYYSHLVGMRKPDVAIYRYVVERHGLNPETTLFIDDNLSNVEGAKAAGLHGFHLRGELLEASLPFLSQT